MYCAETKTDKELLKRLQDFRKKIEEGIKNPSKMSNQGNNEVDIIQ